jgi:hypothetical protein
MERFVCYLSIITSWIAIPCLAISGICFYIRQKDIESLILASGIALLAIGELTQLFSPFSKMTIDAMGKMLSSSGPPLSWYTGSIIISIGLIVTAVGFALVTRKAGRVHNSDARS